MKKNLSLILVFALVLLAGCRQEEPKPQGIPFYYCAAQPAYSIGDTVITAEYRSIVPTDSLQQVLEIYLMGPRSEGLVSPFPEGLQILSVNQEDKTVQLVVSLELAALTGLDLTMACGCLSLTCLALTDAEQVQISPIYGLLDGQRTITMDKNTLLLLDSSREGE